MYQIIDEKIIGRKVDTNSDFLQLKVVHIVCDTAASVPEPLPKWAAGSRCDVLADSGNVYILSVSGEWKQVNFYNRGGSGGDFDPENYYTKPQTDARITEKVAEIVAEAPEDFDTLKEMSDWISQHEESAAAMNTAIQGKVDKVSGKGLSTNDYTTEEKTKLASISANASDVGQLYPDSTHGEIFNNYKNNVASGDYSHAEGTGTTASGPASHAEGNSTTSSSSGTHAEGGNTTASGIDSHAEGYTTIASGRYSHAEGMGTSATGEGSHSEGIGTWACGEQHVQGRYNKHDTSCKYSFIIGNGTDDSHRSDAFAVGWNGLIYQNNSETGVDLNNKVDKVAGKGLSTNDYTTAEKTKLSGIEEGATKTIVDTNLSSTSTNPVQNKAVQAPIARLVDAGAKNRFDIETAYTSSASNNTTNALSNGNLSVASNGTYARLSLPYLYKSGTAIFSCTVSEIAISGGTVQIRFAKNSDSSSAIANPINITGNDEYTREIVIEEDTPGYIIFYLNATGTSYQNSAIFSKIMVCTAEDYAISQEFVPYTPTMHEIYEKLASIALQ